MSEAFTIQVPVCFKKQGARRLILAPDGADDRTLSTSQKPDASMINALVKAWHWQKQIETGRLRSIGELAEREKITRSYACRILRLNSLAPDIKRAILNGTHPKTLRVIDLMPPFSEIWAEQRMKFGFTADAGR